MAPRLHPPRCRARIIPSNEIRGGDTAAWALLEARGYAPTRHFCRMVLNLDPGTPAPPPAWPPGIAVRAFVPGRDDRAAFAAVEEAFVDHWEHNPADYGRGGGSGSSARATIPPWGRSWALASEGTEIVGTVLCRYNGEMGWAN